jgi:hypothetical protein
MKDHKVQAGECMTSIADQYKFFIDTLWDHPANKDLKAKRKDPTRLMAGDTVKIPDPRPRSLFAHTGQRFVVRLRGIPAKLRLQFLHPDGSPRAGEPWKLEFEDEKLEGTLTGWGMLEADVPPEVQSAQLTLGEGDDMSSFELQLGHLDPVEEVSGMQARLTALGYDCGGVSGKMDDATKEALKHFQGAHGLEETGDADEKTIETLRGMSDSFRTATT